MKVTLYSTNCPRCKVLVSKLDAANIKYDTITDVDTMVAKGLKNAPNLEVDGEILDFKAAVDWLRGMKNGNN